MSFREKRRAANRLSAIFLFESAAPPEMICNWTTPAFGTGISRWNVSETKASNSVTSTDALAAVNNQPVQTARLRNGDIITLGSVKLQFWLAAVRQRGLRMRELFVWTLVVAVTAAQVTLVYWLIR